MANDKKLAELLEAVYDFVEQWSYDPTTDSLRLIIAAKEYDEDRYWEAFTTGSEAKTQDLTKSQKRA